MEELRRLNQAVVFLCIALAFCITTIIFGRNNAMVVTFGGITFAFILTALIHTIIVIRKKK